MANILESSVQSQRAINETVSALAVFEQLGAFDTGNTGIYLAELKNRRKQQGNDESTFVPEELSPSTRSSMTILDDFMTERLLDASVSRKLLLHELASVSRDQASARAA